MGAYTQHLSLPALHLILVKTSCLETLTISVTGSHSTLTTGAAFLLGVIFSSLERHLETTFPGFSSSASPNLIKPHGNLARFLLVSSSPSQALLHIIGDTI